MVEKAASFVLGLSASTTRGYASGADFTAALLDGPFDHPTGLGTAIE